MDNSFRSAVKLARQLNENRDFHCDSLVLLHPNVFPQGQGPLFGSNSYCSNKYNSYKAAQKREQRFNVVLLPKKLVSA